jgi:hypothetical protein
MAFKAWLSEAIALIIPAREVSWIIAKERLQNS